MSNEAEEKKKREIASVIERLVVADFGGKSILGSLSLSCDRPNQILVKGALPITVQQQMMRDARGEVSLTQFLQLATFHWCRFEPVAKLYLPNNTGLYFVKDQSAEAQALFGKAYIDFIEELQRLREQEREEERLKGNLVQPARLGDELRVAQRANALRGPHG